MNSNVEIISIEMIKPSSQTPDHLKIFELSLFDQFASSIYVPIIFFYESDESKGLVNSNYVQISQNLKNSLCETLNLFYPLAGRVRDDGTAVDCNDAGAEFVEARVHSRLTESTREPDVEELKKFLPVDLTADFPSGGALLVVQLNFFDCGGIAIGICVSHQIVDASSIMMFVTTWAATRTRERSCKISPFEFQLSRYFPVKEFSGPNNLWETLLMPDANLATKRLVFTKEKLAALRQSVVSSTRSTVEDPTRVELVSAFVWQHMSEFFRNHPEKGPLGAFHSVNLRARVGRSRRFLQNVFGNFVAAAFVFPGVGVEEFHETVRKFRTTIRSIDVDVTFGSSEARDGKISEIFNLFTNGEIKEWYFFTSWCKYPIYEVDFGWGKPIFVSVPTGAVKNGIVLMDAKNGEDIHVWVYMDQEIVQILETQIKLISYSNESYILVV